MSDIRPATVDDAPALAALRWEFRAGRHPPSETEDAFVARCSAWMREELDAGTRWHAWVAVDGGAIVGQVWLQILSKVPNPIGEKHQHAYLSNLYVRPSARGGVGARLLEAALAFAASSGADRVVLWPTERSVPLYERHGFVHNGDVMELKVT